MNRQHRRLMQRQGQLADDGFSLPEGSASPRDAEPVEERPAERRQLRPVPGAPTRRTSPRQFVHEVNVELRKVAWPSKAETINYSVVVFIALAVLMALIFGLDLAFSNLASYLFK